MNKDASTKNNHLTNITSQLDIECNNLINKLRDHNLSSFSEDTYNRISLPAMKRLNKLILDISNLKKKVPVHKNLGLIIFTDIQKTICDYLFINFEKKYLDKKYLVNLDELNLIKHHQKKKSLKNFVSKIFKDIVFSKKIVFKLNELNVEYLGLTTFSWLKLRQKLKSKKINLYKGNHENIVYIPSLQDQLNLLIKAIEDIQNNFIETFNINYEEYTFFNHNEYIKKLNFISKNQIVEEKKIPDMVIMGTIGNDPQLRALVLDYMNKGVHTALIQHGAHYYIFEEPWFTLYEGIIADSKIIYGDCIKQKSLKTLGPEVNVLGKKINFVARTDSYLSGMQLSNKNKIKQINSFKNKKVLYLSGDFTGPRYGPHRDINPAIYFKWQSSMLSWLSKRSLNKPIIRLHPKRRSKYYDPIEYNDFAGFNSSTYNEVDVIIIDVPTTPFAYVNATSKPVIFFDLGLRKIHPEALKIIQKRCHYNKVDWLDFKKSFSDIDSKLNEQRTDEFTNTFSKSISNLKEEEIVANFIEVNLKSNSFEE